MTTIKRKILSYLSLNEYVTRSRVLKYLKMNGISIGDRRLRKEVSSLIHDEGHVISSSPKGWKLARTSKDVEATRAYLKAYIKRLSKRLRNLDRNYHRKTSKLFA